MKAQSVIEIEAGEDAGEEHWADRAIGLLGQAGRPLALLAAWAATAGSLYMSEVLGWAPCVLCWYQRILMYPLALILPIGLARRDRGIHLYVLPLSLAGAGLALYHHLLIKTRWFPPPACSVGTPCTVDYLNWFGFITIPFLALVAFLIISVGMLSWMAHERETRGAHQHEGLAMEADDDGYSS